MTAEEKVKEIIGDRKFTQLKAAGIDFLYCDQARFLLMAADCQEQDYKAHEQLENIREHLKYN
jgi:hypothetical protein